MKTGWIGVVAVGLIIGAVIMCLVHGHRASHRAPSAMYRAYDNGHVPGASISPPQWSPPMAQPYSYPMSRPGRIAPLRRYVSTHILWSLPAASYFLE